MCVGGWVGGGVEWVNLHNLNIFKETRRSLLLLFIILFHIYFWEGAWGGGWGRGGGASFHMD